MQLPPIPPPPRQGTITLSYSGFWALIDSKIRVSVNGYEVGYFSFKKPFRIDIPVTQVNMHLHAVLGGIRKADIDIHTTPGQCYQVFLDYDRILGGISFVLRR